MPDAIGRRRSSTGATGPRFLVRVLRIVPITTTAVRSTGIAVGPMATKTFTVFRRDVVVRRPAPTTTSRVVSKAGALRIGLAGTPGPAAAFPRIRSMATVGALGIANGTRGAIGTGNGVSYCRVSCTTKMTGTTAISGATPSVGCTRRRRRAVVFNSGYEPCRSRAAGAIQVCEPWKGKCEL